MPVNRAKTALCERTYMLAVSMGSACTAECMCAHYKRNVSRGVMQPPPAPLLVRNAKNVKEITSWGSHTLDKQQARDHFVKINRPIKASLTWRLAVADFSHATLGKLLHISDIGHVAFINKHILITHTGTDSLAPLNTRELQSSFLRLFSRRAGKWKHDIFLKRPKNAPDRFLLQHG